MKNPFYVAVTRRALQTEWAEKPIKLLTVGCWLTRWKKIRAWCLIFHFVAIRSCCLMPCSTCSPSLPLGRLLNQQCRRYMALIPRLTGTWINVPQRHEGVSSPWWTSVNHTLTRRSISKHSQKPGGFPSSSSLSIFRLIIYNLIYPVTKITSGSEEIPEEINTVDLRWCVCSRNDFLFRNLKQGFWSWRRFFFPFVKSSFHS